MVEIIKIIKAIIEVIIFGTITLFGLLIPLFLCVVLPFIVLSKVYARFRRNEKLSSFLYILLGIGGALWGSIVGVLFTPRGSFNPVAVILPAIIGYFLGYMCKLPNKTLLVKIIFSFFVISFVVSPIVASFTFPSFESKDLIEKAREKTTKKNLKNIREAISVYYKNNGVYPTELKDQIFVKDTTDFPKAILQRKIDHSNSNKLLIVHTKPNQKIQLDQITDKGGWIYSPDSGDIRINCNHKDSKGVPYYEW